MVSPSLTFWSAKDCDWHVKRGRRKSISGPGGVQRREQDLGRPGTALCYKHPANHHGSACFPQGPVNRHSAKPLGSGAELQCCRYSRLHLSWSLRLCFSMVCSLCFNFSFSSSLLCLGFSPALSSQNTLFSSLVLPPWPLGPLGQLPICSWRLSLKIGNVTSEYKLWTHLHLHSFLPLPHPSCIMHKAYWGHNWG